MAMLTSMGDTPEARRVQLGNMIFRGIRVIAVLPFLPMVVTLLPLLPDFGGGRCARSSTFMSVSICAAPGLHRDDRPMSRLTRKLLPDAAKTDDPSRPRYLAASAVDSPSVALANAAREALRMATPSARSCGSRCRRSAPTTAR